MFYESNCHRWEVTCFCRSTYCIYIYNSLLKIKNKNTNIYIYFEQLRMINIQQTSAIEVFAVLIKFSSPSLSESDSNFLILTTCFFGGMVVNFDINVYIIARENSCKMDQAPYSVQLIQPGTVWHLTVPNRASADVIIYMYKCCPAPVQKTQYDMWLCKRKSLKIVWCLGNYQICQWCANRWNHMMSVLFCDHSIRDIVLKGWKTTCVCHWLFVYLCMYVCVTVFLITLWVCCRIDWKKNCEGRSISWRCEV